MKSPASLPKGAAFDTAYTRGPAITGPFCVVRALPGETGRTRWGFAVGKKQWKKASDRNRIRRRLREAARRVVLSRNLDIVVTARSRAERATISDLLTALERQLNAYREESPR
jgi:ribonuclease P protein component